MRRMLNQAGSVFLGSVVLAGVAMPSSAFAARQALLIGVGHYTNNVGADLPATNDLNMMIDVSRRQGTPDTSIHVLASVPDPSALKVRPAGLATRSEILAQLDRLVATARRGDQVTIYFSGHGIQLPDQPAGSPGHDEADGYDEAILPADTSAHFDQARFDLIGAIRDDDIEPRLSKLRRNGVVVWFVADSCHSGTVTRSSGGAHRRYAKYVDPANLGIPTVNVRPTDEASFTFPQVLGPDASSLTAFYAVPSDVQALGGEWLHNGVWMKSQSSLLTYAIHTAMVEGARSFEELAQRTRMVYEEQSERPPRVLPQFEGDLTPALLDKTASNAATWPAGISGDKVRIRAGELDISQGAIVRVRDLANPDDGRLYRVDTVSLNEAIASPRPGVISFAAARPGFENYRAELVSNPVGLETIVKVDGQPGSPLVATARRAIEALAGTVGSAITVAAGSQEAQLSVRAGPDRIWIAPSGEDPAHFVAGNVREPVHVDCAEPSACEGRLRAAVGAMARGARITRVLVGSANSGVTDRLDVSYAIRRHSENDSTPCASSWGSAEGLTFAQYSAAGLPRGGLALGNCDEIFVRYTYRTDPAWANDDNVIDVTPLYIGADGTIGMMLGYQREPLHPGESVVVRQRGVRATRGGAVYPFGSERVAVIAVRRNASDPNSRFDWLASDTGGAISAASRGSSDGLSRALAEADSPRSNRAATVADHPTGVLIIPIDFAPRDEVSRASSK